MIDPINRQDAIKVVSDLLKGVFVKNEDIARKAIEKLPSLTMTYDDGYSDGCKDDRQDTAFAYFNGYINGHVDGYAKGKVSTQPERRTGQWKVQTIKGKDLVYCSECGFGKHVNETRRYSYCPDCGAMMVKGGTDG